MAKIRVRKSLSGFLERESLSPDLNRAFRCMVAFMVPLLAVMGGWIKMDPVHACIAAQTVALVDVRGGYSLRLGLFVVIAAVLTGAVWLAGTGVDDVALAWVGTAVVVGLGGVWRHLSPDYGPGLAVSSSLLFFLSLAPQGWVGEGAVHPGLATLAGAGFGTLLQVMLWPFHPQHPLRRTVGESWMALADLMDALAKGEEGRGQVVEREVGLRATLNRSQATLHAGRKLPGNTLRQLELLNIAAARLGLRVIAFKTAFGSLPPGSGRSSVQTGLMPALSSLTNLVRMVALTTVSRQQSHWNLVGVRMKRAEHLLEVARSQIQSRMDDPVAAGQLVHLIGQIEEQLPIVKEALGNTMDRTAGRAAFSMELFDLGTLTLRPLAASLNISRKFDPALVRHTLRAVLLAVIGVGFFKFSGFPHGYWLPFTVLVVLQPDFGSTRKKAFERVAGTLAGGVLASSLLWLHPPQGTVMVAIAVTVALFAYFQKRNYGLAVVFVTLMVALLMESRQPVTLAFTLERMGSTLGGGLLALSAALVFWPAWERRRFPAIMGKALRANRDYFQQVAERLRDGGRYDEVLAEGGQSAESANSEAFSSLKRMMGDPKNQQSGLQQAAALANGNQRVAQALSVIALHLNDQKTIYPEFLAEFYQLGMSAFEALVGWEERRVRLTDLEERLKRMERFRLPELVAAHADPGEFREPWVFPQLERIVTELSAMLLIIRPGAGEGREI